MYFQNINVPIGTILIFRGNTKYINKIGFNIFFSKNYPELTKSMEFLGYDLNDKDEYEIFDSQTFESSSLWYGSNIFDIKNHYTECGYDYFGIHYIVKGDAN